MATQRNDDLEVTELVEGLARAGRAAQRVLARKTDAEKSAALKLAAGALRDSADDILAANARDMAAGEANGLTGALLDRLRLDSGRLEAMAAAVDAVADLPDPVGDVIDTATRPNGLVLSRVRVPIGLIGIIYESRPHAQGRGVGGKFEPGDPCGAGQGARSGRNSGGCGAASAYAGP